MEFRIADTFIASLGRLTAQEQKATKTTAFDLQLNPASPGLSFHKLDRAKDKNFWSLRVNADIRIIVHKIASSMLLLYVDHHDRAYRWAERRKIERHPTTGAMQVVLVHPPIEEQRIYARFICVDRSTAHPYQPKPLLFNNLRTSELMAFGIPEGWINNVRLTTEDKLFDTIEHLPSEAQEALLKIAAGEKPQPPEPAPIEADPFAHPDAQRRFRVLTNAEELRQALNFSGDKCAMFLHPAQADLVARSFLGPTRVFGSAGTGKTIIALHRAVHLARTNSDSTVLLTTYSAALANTLQSNLASLIADDPRLAKRITVKAISAVGFDLYSERFGQPQLASPALIKALISKAATEVEGHRFSIDFLTSEWEDVVDAWQLRSWDDYRNVSLFGCKTWIGDKRHEVLWAIIKRVSKSLAARAVIISSDAFGRLTGNKTRDASRLGRKTSISGKQREVLWSIFWRVREDLAALGAVTWSDIFDRLTESIQREGAPPYDFAVIDEAQDLHVAEARFLAAMAASRANGLFFVGDLSQRICQQPFSWKALGLDVRGRSFTLGINYRTSHQIRFHADRLLQATVSDLDGNTQARRGTVSVFDGPPPKVIACKDEDHECQSVGNWIKTKLEKGCAPHQVGVFVRSEAELKRARAAVKAAGVRAVELNDKNEIEDGAVAISTMHFAKGLEFRSVAVMACDNEVTPQLDRIESVSDDADLEEVYRTERHLLYVACTRARDHLLVSGIAPVSEFVDDFLKGK